MKIAILGSCPESLYLLQHFAALDAHVTLWGSLDPFELMMHSKKVWNYDWDKALNDIKGKVFYRPDNLSRVQKSFLNHSETLSRSRMCDMFRVIYEKDGLEFYEEYDFVIEANDFSCSSYLGGSAPALGENILKNKGHSIFYNFQCLENPPQESDTSIAIIGENELSCEFLSSVKSWLEKKSTKKVYLLNYHNESSDFSSGFIDHFEKKLDQEIKKFEADRSTPEPIAQVEAFRGFEVTAIDYLDDREHLYLTVEFPEFRRELFDKSEGSKDLQSIAVNKAYGFTSRLAQSMNLPNFVLDNEPGYYKIEGISRDENDLSNKAKKIQEDMGKYFSRA